MLAVRLYSGSKSMEKYLNNKADKGYILDSITPFSLFVPLKIDIYKFKKSKDRKRIIYRVDSRNVKKEDMQEYKQIFLDDGWHYFNDNYANDTYTSNNIFYSDDPLKSDIFSDEESKKARDRDSAVQSLWKGIFLALVFLYFQVLFPTAFTSSDNGFIAFVSHNFYIIVAIVIIIISLIQYIKNK